MLFENVVLQSLDEKDDNTHCVWNVRIPISPIRPRTPSVMKAMEGTGQG